VVSILHASSSIPENPLLVIITVVERHCFPDRPSPARPPSEQPRKSSTARRYDGRDPIIVLAPFP
jgi:hypothetical protein